MFDTELLKSFVAVAESRGFTRAAARLHSTQSTVSAQIQRLENDAGHPLFVRSTRSVRLTPAGELLLGYARTILRLNEDARLHLSGARHVGRLRVGAAEDLAGWLPKILRAFSRQYPEVCIDVEIGIGTSLFKMLETQELDLAVGGCVTNTFRVADYGKSHWCGRLRLILRCQIRCRLHSSPNHVRIVKQRCAHLRQLSASGTSPAQAPVWQEFARSRRQGSP